MKKIALFLVAMVFTCLSAFGQNVDKKRIVETLREIRTTIASLHQQSGSSAKRLDNCRQIINDAIINIDSRDAPFSESYLQSLLAVKMLVNSVNSANQESQPKIIEIVFSDLRLKFKYLTGGIVDQGFAQFVSVTVVTKGKSNLRVNYTGLGYNVDHKNPEHQFKRLTSPATEEMVPGIYEVWITNDKDNKVLKSQQVEIDPGKKDNTIEF